MRADRFLKYIVRAALPEPTYVVERADEHDSPLAITAAMLSSIVESDICVADITGRNPNVFYELALAHAMDKHVVIMDGDKEKSPFDIQDQRAIKYGLMPEEIEAAVKQLRAKSINTGSTSAFRDMMNPVATAFRTWTTQQKVATAGDTTEQMLLRVVERLEEKVDNVERRFGGDDELSFRESISEVQQLLEHVQQKLNVGNIDPSHSWVVGAGYDAIENALETRSLAMPHRWMREANRVLSRRQEGEPPVEGFRTPGTISFS